MKIRPHAVLVGLALGLVSTSVSADAVNERMRQMFGAHTNVTRPGVVEGATRGVITGGNVTVRTPIRSMSGFTFDPPNVSAGCGGIDLYGGNLSFPDKEQYVQMGRAIIGNIGGAAFRMALKQTCELCDSIMSSIQETVNMLNFDDMSSCQIAQQMTSAAVSGENPFSFAAESGQNMAASWAESAGMAKSKFDAYRAGPGEKSPVADVIAESPEMARVLQGNLVWDAMRESGMVDWLGDNRTAREEVLSLLGTVVVCAEASTECPQTTGAGDTGAFTFRPTLTLSEYATLEGGASEEYDIYSCAQEECLKPTVVKRRFGKTAAQMVYEAFIGTPDQPGLIDRVTLPGDQAGSQSSMERTIVASHNVLAANVFRCAKSGERGRGEAKFIVEALAPQIAAESLHLALVQTIQQARRHLTENGQNIGAGPALALLEETRMDLDRQLAMIQTRTKSNDMVARSIELCSGSALVSHLGLGV